MKPKGSQFGKLYHGTWADGGPEFLKSEYVHVGTKRAALSRVDPMKWDREEPAHDIYTQGRTRLYELQIKPDATVDSKTYSDSVAGELGFRPYSGADVTPYINEYEDPGSTSYLVKSSALERVRPVGRTPDLLRKEPDYPAKDELPWTKNTKFEQQRLF